MMASSSSSSNNNNTMSTSSSSTNPDTVLFGSLPSVVSDEFDSKIDAALMKGVGSLPLLPSGTDGEELFLSKLRASYRRNVDLLEQYIERNIFTISNYSISLRDKILQCFMSSSSTNTGGGAVEAAKVMVVEQQDEQQKESTTDDTTTIPPPPLPYPKKLSDIPTQQDMDKLREETAQLRAQLRAARAQKNDLQRKLVKLVDVDQSVKGANETLNANNTNNTHNSVTAMIVGKQGLEYSKQEAKVLSRSLDEQEYSSEDEDENNNNASSKRPKLTLEQQYNQDTANIKTSPSGLAAMQELLEQKKK